MELYKKYRPSDFDEMIGNEGVIKSIKSKLEKNNLPHFIILAGNPGTGKCITGDSLIMTEDGIVPIEKYKTDINGFTDKQIEIVDNRERLKTDKFFQEKANQTIRIATKKGYELEGTPEHPILVFQKDLSITFKRLEDIQHGDYACISRGRCYFQGINNYFSYSRGNKNLDVYLKDFSNQPLDAQLNYLQDYLKSKGLSRSKAKNSRGIFKIKIQKEYLNLARMMMLNFGLITKKEDDSHISFNVKACFENIFMERDFKENRPSTDIVPFVKDYLNDFIPVLKNGFLRCSNSCYRAIPYRRDREFTYKKLQEFYYEVIYSRIPVYEDIYNDFIYKVNIILENDYYFDKIVVKERKNEPKMVYDFSIPKVHRFFSNGFISHNTTMARILKDKLEIDDEDFQEINAADKNGVEDCRAIARAMNYRPLKKNKARLFLFDEAHRLSDAAFTTLLKPLEDTPDYVYVIFATSEPTKLPKPILSRGTIYKFNPLNDIEMRRLIKEISKQEGFELDKELINRVVDTAAGSARTALVSLDKIKDLEPEEAAKELEKYQNSESCAYKLLEALIWKNQGWQSVANILKDLNEDPERVRRYLMTVASNGLCDVTKAKNFNKYDMLMVCFKDPFYNNGKSDLVLACRDFYLQCYESK